MSDVVDLGEERRRRRGPATNEEYADLIRASTVEYSEAVTRELDRMWDRLTIDSVSTPPPLFRGAEPSWTVFDETHLWTEDNPAWQRLAEAIDGRPGVFEWTNATPESTAAANRALRILHSTDQGSHDGAAQGDRGDAPPAR